MSERKFESEQAKRERVPLLIGLAGPSGCGKTYSALRLATGIQSVTGGKIVGIDTESGRMDHYAPRHGEQADPSQGTFAFERIRFAPPHGSLDYLAALRHAAKLADGGVVVVDSMTHEHEGDGGYLSVAHATMQGKASRSALGWAKASEPRKALINGMLAIPNTTFIFCYRAKEKLDWKNKTQKGEPTPLGWMPIGGEDFVFEMTACCMLPPRSNGVPMWQTEMPGERVMMKLPRQFEPLFAKPNTVLSEEIGAAMARWAMGGSAVELSDAYHEFTTRIGAAQTEEELTAIIADIKKSPIKQGSHEHGLLVNVFNQRKKYMEAA